MSASIRPPLFDYFDVIRVIDIDGSLPDIDRRFGVVLGKSQTESGRWIYAIDVYSDLACTDRIDGWCIPENSLVATGHKVSRDHVYGGQSVKLPTEER